jgi:hypothetical protein
MYFLGQTLKGDQRGYQRAALSLAKYYKVETTTARQAIRAGFHRRMIHS